MDASTLRMANAAEGTKKAGRACTWQLGVLGQEAWRLGSQHPSCLCVSPTNEMRDPSGHWAKASFMYVKYVQLQVTFI